MNYLLIVPPPISLSLFINDMVIGGNQYFPHDMKTDFQFSINNVLSFSIFEFLNPNNDLTSVMA